MLDTGMAGWGRWVGHGWVGGGGSSPIRQKHLRVINSISKVFFSLPVPTDWRFCNSFEVWIPKMGCSSWPGKSRFTISC